MGADVQDADQLCSGVRGAIEGAIFMQCEICLSLIQERVMEC